MSVPPSHSRAAALSAAAGLTLVLVAHFLPPLTYKDIDLQYPPLHAYWDPRFVTLTIPAVAVGLLLWLTLPLVARAVSWRTLLLVAYVTTWTWTMALAMTDGKDGLASVFARRQEYVYDAQRVGSIHTMMHTFIERIPLDSPHNWYVHVAGHPPGALLFFVLLDRIGVTGFFSIGLVVVTLASTAVVAVLITLRTLGSITLAREAMPWLVLAPSAVWMGVNGDALFTAVAAWGLALLAIAAVTRHLVPAIGSGLLLGLCVYLSYGLPLLGVLAITVLIIAKSWRPLPWAIGGAMVVVAMFTAGGFSWWEAYPVLRERYYAGIASARPYSYWVWADIAAWTFTVGLAVWAAFPHAVRALRSRSDDMGDGVGEGGAEERDAERENAMRRDHKVMAQLAAAAVLTIGLAAVSGMSKAETERIFLPFTIWVVALPLLLPTRWRSPLLLSQVVLAIGVQTLLLTRW
ncbi:hypothetical protein [Aeromicrobium sp.]|uniref:hypothetical protein n=1 Tax=Aeromicrobium sp. TaxID=1871063 RepID=UPI0019C3A824|nr:hypothetical protein [Aeromicrobium sp.]MBC7633772.1 hypothetical protein [Aeromicrobium sp.]